VLIVCLLSHAEARGHSWAKAHIHPTGQCGFSKEVFATYYGSESKGRNADGSVWHPGGLSAASWDYPFGTVLGITNPSTGLSVQVVIKDRGPAKHLYRIGFVLDLSVGAAHHIHLGQHGRFESGHVCVSVISVGEGSRVRTDTNGNRIRGKRPVVEYTLPEFINH
jgi:rare lipoprotein A